MPIITGLPSHFEYQATSDLKWYSVVLCELFVLLWEQGEGGHLAMASGGKKARAVLWNSLERSTGSIVNSSV